MSTDMAAREAASTLLLSRKNVNPQDLGSEDLNQNSTQNHSSRDSTQTDQSTRNAINEQDAFQRMRRPIRLKKQHFFYGAIAVFVFGMMIIFAVWPSSKSTKPDIDQIGLSKLDKPSQKSDLSLGGLSQQTNNLQQGQNQDLNLNRELTQLPEIPAQNLAQSSAEIDSLKEKISTLENQLTETMMQLTEKEKELKGISQSVGTLESNAKATEKALSKLPTLEAEVTNIKNTQEYTKVVQAEKENKTAFQILNEESIEIYGKVYYIGSIIKYENKKYVIKKIDFNNGVFLQDGAQQIYRIPIKK